MVRLIKQARITTKGLGSLFPEPVNPALIHDVLDIACGPGEWVLHVAQAYPHVQITGIDISHTMIQFAKNISGATPNAQFQIMDILQPLDFPDNSFDLVNIRFIFGFMKTSDWPKLLQEGRRILRPGGVLVLTEPEFGSSNSLAFDQINYLFAQALYRVGQSFSPDGRHIGILPMLGQLLADAGFEHQQQILYGSDLSAGTQLHQDVYENYRALFHLAQPFLLQTAVTTAEEFEKLYHQMVKDVGSATFRAVGYSSRAWGYKPAEN
jgi:ubiquinone/menaquinone biosynthesis C-methylase UbiE